MSQSDGGRTGLMEHILARKKRLPSGQYFKHIKRIPFTGFNNIKACLRILGTSPVTTFTCERSFSAKRRLETYAKSTMLSERLNGISLMHVR